MNVLIVFAHPELKSFNGAMFHTAVRTLITEGHSVATSDLHRMSFNPVSGRHNFTSSKDRNFLKLQQEEIYATEHNSFASDVEAEIRKLEECDLLILQFPMWWCGLPAILKGWVDRVFAMGRIYGSGHMYQDGKFRGKRAMLSLTTGGPQESYTSGGRAGDIMAILRPVHRGILQFVGFDVLSPQINHAPARVQKNVLRASLAEWERRLGGIFDEPPFVVGEY